MMKAVVYKGGEHLGEVEIHLQNHQKFELKEKKLRITHFSHPSERCSPLAVLHTISSSGIFFKIDAQESQETPLLSLYSSCLKENKTAVVPLGSEELHLVAMPSKTYECKFPYFWGYSVPPGLYSCCLAMLNLRCLGIVFDLDETLIVANSMRSFEDKIDALQRKVKNELDQQRVSSMLAEITRYQDDKNLLKQYAETDQVVDNGKVITIQTEVVPVLSGNHPSTIRPLIRLHERNIILTRINPLIRDTSVLVRLRPAWEDLRSYLTARGRKRFEVYVCTMAERDYALEMWRLLDPEFSLINSKELLNRIVCVKSGSKKSLFNVFQDGICHPKMALVIDDRLKVWDERDQPRVHVVPAFAPYYSPLAEGNNTVPVLCVARNVACNVRGGFFKEFDDGILQWISKVSYEDDVKAIPSPDVSNYLLSDVQFEDGSTSNGNKEPPGFSGLADPEVEKRLKDGNPASFTVASTSSNIDSRIGPHNRSEIDTFSISLPVSTTCVSNALISKELPPPPLLPHVKPLSHPASPDSNLPDSPAREEGEVPESELDPDTRRRLLILQHGQDTRDHTSNETPFPTGFTPSTSLPTIHHSTTWLPVEDERNQKQRNRVVPKEFPLDPEFLIANKHKLSPPPFFSSSESSVQSDRVIYNNHRSPFEVYNRDDTVRSNHPIRSICGEEAVPGRSSSGNWSFYPRSGRLGNFADTPVRVLKGTAMKCGTTLEFRTSLVDTTELMFSIEVWLDGEKIGSGVGRTRKEAQHHAAESSLKNMSYKNQSYVGEESRAIHNDFRSGLFCERRNGNLEDMNSCGNSSFSLEESNASPSSLSHPFWFHDTNSTFFNNPMASITALKDLCMMEGLDLVFQPQVSAHMNSFQKGQVHVQVEVDGQIMGKGSAPTWDEAKLEASDKALCNLKSILGHFSEKPHRTPFSGMLNKRLKKDNSGGFRRTHSGRYTSQPHQVP